MLYKEINDNQEKLDLLGDMVRLQNQIGVSSFEWALRIKHWLIEMPTKWTLLEAEGLLNKKMADLWIEENGIWEHSHSKITQHNLLGMAYAWWASNENPGIKELYLSDSPDFSGTFNNESVIKSSFHGDIKSCTPNAIMNGLTYIVKIHDVWISVLDWNRQVIIEFYYAPSSWIKSNLEGLFSQELTDTRINAKLEDVFFCKGCNTYHIDKQARKAYAIDLKNKKSPK